MDSVHLFGAEDVRNSGHAISSAAQQIQTAVSHLGEYLDLHARRQDEALTRLEAILREDREARGLNN